MPKELSRGYVGEKVGHVSEQRVPKGFQRQAQSARLAIDEMKWDPAEHTGKKPRVLGKETKEGILGERIRVKAAKKKVKLSSKEAFSRLRKAAKGAKLFSAAVPAVVKKVTEATLAQQRASRRSGIISSTRTREM